MRTILTLASVALAAGCAAPAIEPAAPETKPGRPITRLFVQDLKTCSLNWADLRQDGKGGVALDTLRPVAGFPKLDPAKQKLVQMAEAAGLVCVGVRDDADGSHASGWALLDAGVGYEDHGDHGHWLYENKPAVRDARLDAKQGNPAHLYVYDRRFYLANDKLAGYTRLDPKDYDDGKKGTPRFVAGGGGHITLAVLDDKVGYGCWIDGGGPNKGRVDVTPLTTHPRSEPAYSFHLPHGGIHGAIACEGKVFFAPVDGVCWVEADLAASRQPADVKVHHIDLGKEGDKPRRTGAFVRHGRHVVFTTGKAANPALAILDAKAAEPKPTFVPLAVEMGRSPTTPAVVTARGGKAYALVFHDHAKDVEATDALEVVDLDPDGDGSFADAKVVKKLAVGDSAVEGHFGHHDVAFDADGRYAVFTNPGDGTVSVLALKTLDVVATFPVGGTPATLVARGGLETDD